MVVLLVVTLRNGTNPTTLRHVHKDFVNGIAIAITIANGKNNAVGNGNGKGRGSTFAFALVADKYRDQDKTRGYGVANEGYSVLEDGV